MWPPWKETALEENLMAIFPAENSHRMFSLKVLEIWWCSSSKSQHCIQLIIMWSCSWPLSQTVHTASMHLKCMSDVLYYVGYYWRNFCHPLKSATWLATVELGNKCSATELQKPQKWQTLICCHINSWFWLSWFCRNDCYSKRDPILLRTKQMLS